MQKYIGSEQLQKFNCFIAGFAIISSLLITIRQMAPFIGENIVIMGMTISIFLTSIYYGYNDSKNQLNHNNTNNQKNFLIIASLVGAGLSYIFIDFFNIIIRSINQNINVFIILFGFLLITIAPIGYYFGKSKIFINNASILGLVSGSIITPIVFMRLFGIATTVFIVFLLFIFISIKSLLTHPYINLKKNINILYLLIIPICYYLNIIVEKNNFVITNAYGNYAIIQDKNKKIFSINHSASSMVQQDTKQGFPYIELIKKILFDDLKLINKNILILGGGGFSFTADGNKNNNITYVDIDPDLKNIVIKYFNKVTYGDLKIADAAVFVKNAKHQHKKYAAVISDVYSSQHIIPSHILNLEYFKNISSILENDGVAIFNIIANPSLNDYYSRDIDTKIRMVFSSCMSIPFNYYSDQVSNIIYVCN